MNIYNKYNYILIINFLINIKKNKKIILNMDLNIVNSKNINYLINFLDMLIENMDKSNIYYDIIQNNIVNLIKMGYKFNTINNYYKRKYFRIINFAIKNNIILENIKIHNDSFYSVTNYYDANYISKLIFKFFNNKDIIITDGTANIGGNTLSFGLFNFKLINSIEINKTCYNYLINNIKCYHLKNIKAFNEDYLNLYKILSQDVVFLDPPWGGPNYKNKKYIELFLSNVNVIDIIEFLINKTKTKLVVLKAPYNYNIKFLKKKLVNIQFKINYLKKFQVFFINKKN